MRIFLPIFPQRISLMKMYLHKTGYCGVRLGGGLGRGKGGGVVTGLSVSLPPASPSQYHITLTSPTPHTHLLPHTCPHPHPFLRTKIISVEGLISVHFSFFFRIHKCTSNTTCLYGGIHILNNKKVNELK